jgi:glycosyltransferase involved in cell wall biosynthesis
MKILIFSVAYHPFLGGAEVAVKEITNRLTDIEFHMLTVNIDGKQKKEEKIGNVCVHRIGSGYVGKLLFPFLASWRASKIHKNENFDATWAIMANYAGFAALFFKYLVPQVPFFLTLQEGDPISYIKRHVWFVYPFFIDIFRRADKIQSISHYLAHFAESMKIRVPVHVIPNGVDVSLFTQNFSAEDLEIVEKKVGKKTGDKFLVTASRLVAKNGLNDVIAALPSLPANVKFLILGVGELDAKLRKQAYDLGVTDRVIFAGFVPYQEIPKYLKISDIFIRPSLSEGMGNSFVEAMASGLPVIATPVGGIPDFLKDGQTGLFCEVKNPKSVAQKVEQIISNPAETAEMVKNAQALVIQNYDWGLIAQEMRKAVFSV